MAYGGTDSSNGTYGPIGTGSTGTSGSASSAPLDAAYILEQSNPTLSASRVLQAGSNITLTDGGPGGPLTISSAGGSGIPATTTLQIINARKTSDEGVTSTVLQNDDHLFVALGANKKYQVRFVVEWSSTTSMQGSGVKLALTIPAGASMSVLARPIMANFAFASVRFNFITASGIAADFMTGDFNVAANQGHFILEGWITTAGAAGNLQLQTALSSNDGSTLTFKANSWMEVREVA